MAAITASMVGELRAKTDAPMMECKKALTEADGDMDKRRRAAARQARQQGRQGVVAGRRRRRRRRSPSKARPGRIVELNCETDFVTKNDSLPGPGEVARRARRRRTTRPTSPRSRRLPLSQDGFGPTVEDVRKGLIGKIGENMSIPPFPALSPAPASWPATCTARASACWSNTRATTRRPRTSPCTSRR